MIEHIALSQISAYGFGDAESLESFITKYNKGSIVEERDEHHIDKLRMLSGMIHQGVHQNDDGEFVSTAKLTSYGKSILKHELRMEKYSFYRLGHAIACFLGPPYKLN